MAFVIHQPPWRFKVTMFLLVVACAFPPGLLLGPLLGSFLGNALGTVFSLGGTRLGDALGMGLAILPGMLVGGYLAGLLSKRWQNSLKPYLTQPRPKTPTD